jgi:glutamate carboxypeptidase
MAGLEAPEAGPPPHQTANQTTNQTTNPTALTARLAELVECESPTGDLLRLNQCADLLTEWGRAVLGAAPQRVVRDGVPHLLWAARDQAVLLLGHLDTVWPAGTVEEWPFSVAGEIATGPGVADMKAGIVQLLHALRTVADPTRVGLLLTGDEESGSVTSRALIEEQGRRSGAVLVCEPSTPAGALKVARKGGSAYQLTVRGRAAHAGVEPHLGVNATVEVAHVVLAVQRFANAAEGTSVTPTVLASGTTSNTVPETARLAVDVRAWTRGELDRVDQLVRQLTPQLSEATITVGGGVNRYPLVPEVSMALLELAQEVAAALGLPDVAGAYAAGASDGNFTGGLGIPTLDGLGGVGGGSHARSEYVNVALMPQRSALLAGLVDRLIDRHLRRRSARR